MKKNFNHLKEVDIFRGWGCFYNFPFALQHYEEVIDLMDYGKWKWDSTLWNRDYKPTHLIEDLSVKSWIEFSNQIVTLFFRYEYCFQTFQNCRKTANLTSPLQLRSFLVKHNTLYKTRRKDWIYSPRKWGRIRSNPSPWGTQRMRLKRNIKNTIPFHNDVD